MAHYDPETLNLLRKVLDEAWVALPDGSKSEAVKSEMAQHILKQAADGVRDPVRLRASTLTSVAREPPASKAKTRLKRGSPPSRDSFLDRVAGFGLQAPTSVQAMAIYRLLKNSTLEPEEIARITKAYEQALHTLCVKDRDDPLTELIAKNVIKIAQTGVHDVMQLSALAIAITELGIR